MREDHCTQTAFGRVARIWRSGSLPIAALVCGVVAFDACASAQLRVPSPRPRTEENACQTVERVLLLWLHGPAASRSFLLAQVAQVDGNPDPEDLNHTVYGGTFTVLETLAGKSGPTTIRVSHDPPPPGLGLFSHYPVYATRAMRLGEYWILDYDTEAKTLDDTFSGATCFLSGPTDTLLACLRRHVTWTKRTDRDQAIAEMRSVVLNGKESEASRVAALRSLAAYVSRGSTDPYRGPDYPVIRSVLAELVKQADLPDPLQRTMINCLFIDGTKEIKAGSDEANLASYLIRTMQTAPLNGLLADASAKLYSIATSWETISGQNVAYEYPDIVAALEQRQTADQAVNPGMPSTVDGTLLPLKEQYALRRLPVSNYEIVTRRLP